MELWKRSAMIGLHWREPERADQKKALTIKRESIKRDVRATKALNADAAIGDLTPGCEIFILTYGQFSLIDAVAALLRKTGPADVLLSTWTAGNVDLSKAADLLDGAEILSFRMIVDRSFLTRQPGYCRKMIELFGLNCLRTWRGHAKFAVIRNEKYTLAVRTSMNLNTNPRLENLEISDDPKLADFLTLIADDLFREQQTDVFDGELPKLGSVEFDDGAKIQMGRATSKPITRNLKRV